MVRTEYHPFAGQFGDNEFRGLSVDGSDTLAIGTEDH